VGAPSLSAGKLDHYIFLGKIVLAFFFQLGPTRLKFLCDVRENSTKCPKYRAAAKILSGFFGVRSGYVVFWNFWVFFGRERNERTKNARKWRKTFIIFLEKTTKNSISAQKCSKTSISAQKRPKVPKVPKKTSFLAGISKSAFRMLLRKLSRALKNGQKVTMLLEMLQKTLKKGQKRRFRPRNAQKRVKKGSKTSIHLEKC
jgi:hypothetical protein